jgi:rSAM/selenodomain-associated transferase 2
VQRAEDRRLVSVIVPALNEAGSIVACVEAARRHYDADEVEIIVVDGGSTDGTPDLTPSYVRLAHAPRGRASQMNRGAMLARGDILLFCHADTRLPAGWREAVVHALSLPGVAGGAFQRRYEPAAGLLIRLLNRAHNVGHWFFVHGDRCQFMTRAVFDVIGGFPELPLMEDLEMSRALARLGRIKMVPLRVISSSRRLLEIGTLRQGLRSIWYCLSYVALGVSAEEIARRYRSSRERYFDGAPLPQQRGGRSNADAGALRTANHGERNTRVTE